MISAIVKKILGKDEATMFIHTFLTPSPFI